MPAEAASKLWLDSALPVEQRMVRLVEQAVETALVLGLEQVNVQTGRGIEAHPMALATGIRAKAIGAVGFACDLQERIIFGLIRKGANDQYVRVDPEFKAPIPVCPECAGLYLPNSWESQLKVVLPVEYKASIIDSNGTVVARSKNSALSQSLSFNPAPFAISRQVGAAETDQTGGAALDQGLAANEVNYYLRIEPVPGTDLNIPYKLSLSVDEGIEAPKPTILFLPVIRGR